MDVRSKGNSEIIGDRLGYYVFFGGIKWMGLRGQQSGLSIAWHNYSNLANIIDLWIGPLLKE